MYDRDLHQLDLCILAYELYAQALLWPMDPYAEEMARPWTRRRDTFMARTRKLFGDRRIPTHLDPILTDLERLAPIRPALAKPEADDLWSVFEPPAPIVDRIGAVHLARTGARATEVLWEADDRAGRPDTLYCFEGMTGARGGRPGHGSFLGFVLERALDDAGDSGMRAPYDLHVVFRGSRSGLVRRSALRGFLGLRGNPDWTTATDLFRHQEHPAISPAGRLSRGFAVATAATLPAIATCLDALDHDGPPRTVHVAGHSLGGALAAHFAAAMVVASPDRGRRPAGGGRGGWRTWPWDNVRLSTFSAPTVGDRAFRDALEELVPTERHLVVGDPVALTPLERWGVHVGTPRPLDPPDPVEGLRWWRPWRRVRQAHHDPRVLRRAMLRRAREEGRDLTGAPAASEGRDPDEPWVEHRGLASILTDHPPFVDDPGALAAALDDIGPRIARYLEVARWVVRRRRAHRFLLRRRRDRRKAAHAIGAVIAAVEAADVGAATPADSAAVWEAVRDPLDDDALHHFLGVCLALTHLSREPALGVDGLGGLAPCLGHRRAPATEPSVDATPV